MCRVLFSRVTQVPQPWCVTPPRLHPQHRRILRACMLIRGGNKRRSASETLARKRERDAHMYDFWTGATRLYKIFLWLDRLPGSSYAVGQCNEPRPQDVSSCRPKIDRMQARQRSGNFIIYKHWKNHLVFHNVEHETGGSFLRKCSRCSTSSGGVLSLGRCLPRFMDVSVCV